MGHIFVADSMGLDYSCNEFGAASSESCGVVWKNA